MADHILGIGEIKRIVVVYTEHAVERAAGDGQGMQIDHGGLRQAELVPIDVPGLRGPIANFAEDRDLARTIQASKILGKVQGIIGLYFQQTGYRRRDPAFQFFHG